MGGGKKGRKGELERDKDVWLTRGAAKHYDNCNAFFKPVPKVTLNLNLQLG